MDIGFLFMIIWHSTYWINFKYFIWCFSKLNYVVEIEVKSAILKHNIKICFFFKCILSIRVFFSHVRKTPNQTWHAILTLQINFNCTIWKMRYKMNIQCIHWNMHDVLKLCNSLFFKLRFYFLFVNIVC